MYLCGSIGVLHEKLLKGKQEALVFPLSLRTYTRPWIQGHSSTQPTLHFSRAAHSVWSSSHGAPSRHVSSHALIWTVLSQFGRCFTTFTEYHEIFSDGGFCVNLVYGSTTKGHTSVLWNADRGHDPRNRWEQLHKYNSLKKTTAGRWRLCSKGTLNHSHVK